MSKRPSTLVKDERRGDVVSAEREYARAVRMFRREMREGDLSRTDVQGFADAYDRYMLARLDIKPTGFGLRRILNLGRANT